MMSRWMISVMLMSAGIIGFSIFSGAGDHEAHWSYEGKTGPEHWGDVNPDYHTCQSGKAQSPIDLKWQQPHEPRPIQFHYHVSPVTVIDNGHTIQVNYPTGSYALMNGQKYNLVQMHFHAQSEHTLSGKRFPMELHFVHKNSEGELAVVGVFFQAGKSHSGVETLWSHLPTEKKREKMLEIKFDPNWFLPKKHTHYHYIGSLTTPPCSEGVSWNVLNTPLEVSSEQIRQFEQLYSGNYRPIQPHHNRKIANF